MTNKFNRKQFILDFVAERDLEPCRLHWHRGHTNGECRTQNPGLRPENWRMGMLDGKWLEDNVETLYECEKEREEYREERRE
jgi:hypothetical protein